MANFLDKAKVPVAAAGKHKETFLSSHISTTDFFQFNVAHYQELNPDESYEVGMETFARMEALARPTYGKASIYNRGFFVPYRTVYPAWNDFIADVPHTYYSASPSSPANTLHSDVPTFNMESLFKVFFGNAQDADTNFATHVPNSGITHDFVIYRGVNTEYYRITNLGRQALKLLHSLGYQLITNDTAANLENPSALPLLCIAKIYIDWYYPSAYAENTTWALLDQLTKRDGYNPTVLTVSDLSAILRYCTFVNYDSDYFVSGWDNPTSPNTGLSSSIGFTDVTNPLSSTNRSIVSKGIGWFDGTNPISVGQPGETPSIIGSGSSAPSYSQSPKNITQYVLDTLKALTDYMKRHQLVGSRVIDRYLVRYGVNLTSEQLNRSVYLGSGETLLRIGDVMSMADTSTASLGDYAGKGIIDSKDKPFYCEYSTKEYGLFVIISSLVPRVSYYQGFDKTVLQTKKTEFWIPEFDNLGTQPIEAKELYVPEDGTSTLWSGLDTQIFAFQPRYAHKKVARDFLTGDFRIPSLTNSGAEDAWHLFRDMDNFASVWSSASDIQHSISFVQGSNDHEQYNRIFLNGVTSQDMFRIIYNFHITKWTPMKPYYDTYQFDPEHGRDVITDANGVKMN